MLITSTREEDNYHAKVLIGLDCLLLPVLMMVTVSRANM